MSLRANKKHRFKKRISARQWRGNSVMGLVVFFGSAIVTMITFISLELAVLAFGFFGLGLIYMVERDRRRNWENSSSFKIINLEEQIDQLADDVARTKYSVDSLKHIISKESGASKPAADPAKIVEVEEAHLDEDEYQGYEIPSNSTLAANDDPFADHASLSDMVVQELVHSAVRNKRIDVFAQPVMRLPQRQPIGFEVYARIRAKAGLYVPAGRYMAMARAEKISSDIDALLLRECLDVMKMQKDNLEKIYFFLNIEPASLKNKKYMSELLAFVAKNRTLARKIVFEIRYDDYKALPQSLLQVINGLTKLGCSFSLDHVDDLDFNLQSLIQHHVRFIKMKSGWMAEQTRSYSDFTHLWRIKNKLESNGIRVVADHIESENELRELLDYDPKYGQGFLFGKPDLLGAYAPFSYAKQPLKRKGVRETFG